MSFFVLMGAILLGTVFIVHFAANALGFRLFYISLFLSALLAFAINLIVISMRDITSPMAMFQIFLAVLLASAFVTTVNELLARREKKKLQAKRQKLKEAREEAKEKVFEETLDESFEDDKEVADEDTSKKTGFFKRIFGKFSIFKKKNKKPEEKDEDAAVIEAEDEPLKAETPDGETLEEAATEEVREEETQKEKILTADTPTEETPKEEAAKTEIPKEEPAKEAPSEKEKPDKKNFVQKTVKKKEPPKREKLDLSQFEDLDSVLDFAYEAKISGRYLDAVEAYEGAIEKYEDDPYWPFLIIDLGNAHKARGEYDAAIDVYEKAVNMPSIKEDSNILKSFEENIAYLKALKKALRKHKIEHKPFGEIDEAILKEAEESA